MRAGAGNGRFLGGFVRRIRNRRGSGGAAAQQHRAERPLGEAGLLAQRRQGFGEGFGRGARDQEVAPRVAGGLRRGEQTRLPLVPIVGLGILPFPVKLRAWIGEPIKIQPGETPESLAARTKQALEQLIAEKQTPGQTLLKAIRQRFTE